MNRIVQFINQDPTLLHEVVGDLEYNRKVVLIEVDTDEYFKDAKELNFNFQSVPINLIKGSKTIKVTAHGDFKRR